MIKNNITKVPFEIIKKIPTADLFNEKQIYQNINLLN